jgi:hypothetical protein
MKILLFFSNPAYKDVGQKINEIKKYIEHADKLGNWIYIPIKEGEKEMWIYEEKNPNDNDWEVFRNKCSNLSSQLEFYIAFHSKMQKNSQDIIKNFTEFFPNSPISHKFFHHEKGKDPVYDEFLKFKEKLILNPSETSNPSGWVNSFDNLIERIQIPWDLENFLELLHLLVNVPQNVTREKIKEKFLTPLINTLPLNENEKNKLNEDFELMMIADEKNILNSDYLKFYKEIYTTLKKYVMEER